MDESEYGSLVKLYRREKREIFGATLTTVPHRPPQSSYGLASDGIRDLVVKGRQLIA